MVESKQKLKLILHIGAGKTGTSSIQKTLQTNQLVLKKRGIEYLGLMLENVEQRLYSWQKPSDIEIFHSLPQEEIDIAIYKIFQGIIKKSEINNTHTLIWSNESFFHRCDKLFPALKRLILEGLEIQFVAYVRQYDLWAKSAYVQWGIKHKTIEGEILPFNQWIKPRMPKFYISLKRLEDLFPRQLCVRNMDGTIDVVKDFYHFSKLNTDDFIEVRTNKSPDHEELFLRTLFNNQFTGQVLPMKFDNFIGKYMTIKQTPTEYLKSYLPTEKDLNEVLISAEKDRVLLNTLLRASEQLEIKSNIKKLKTIEVDSDKLLMSLSQMVIEQSNRIRKLEKIVQTYGENREV